MSTSLTPQLGTRLSVATASVPFSVTPGGTSGIVTPGHSSGFSLAHAGEQPSPGIRLPSSHPSPAPTLPSPQTGAPPSPPVPPALAVLVVVPPALAVLED